MYRNRSLARFAIYATALLLPCLMLAGQQQSSPSLDPSQVSNQFSDKMQTIDQQDETQALRRMHQLNAARQKAMVSDADKLLTLARNLNAGIGADGSRLSASQKMRIAADIEKLARSVKEKMSYVAGNPLAPRVPFGTWP